jgi:hypothetical protein
MLGAKTKALTRHKKGTDFPESLRKHLQVYYDMEPTGQPTILQDKSGYNNNATKNGTVTDTTYLGKNVKTFAGAGNVIMPSGQNVNYLYPFKYDGLIKDIGMHQGITFDSTYWYASHDMFLRKYDANFNIVAEHATINDHTGGNHVGDIDYYNGLIYVVTETYTNCTTFSDQKISTFNASDLSYIESHDVSAQGKDVTGVAVNPDDGLIYILPYCTTTTIQSYSLSDFSFQGDITIPSLYGNQGIDYYDGDIYISSANTLYRLAKTGAIKEILCKYPSFCNECEGICVIDENTIYSIFAVTSPASNKLYRFVRDEEFTINLWIRTTYLPSEMDRSYSQVISTTSYSQMFLIFYQKSGNPSLYVLMAGTNGNGTINTRTQIKESDGLLIKNSFMMITATYDGQYVKLYCNSQPGSVPFFDVGSQVVVWDMLLGGRSGDVNEKFKGDIGEVAILNKALSTDEVVEVYNRTRGKYGV